MAIEIKTVLVDRSKVPLMAIKAIQRWVIDIETEDLRFSTCSITNSLFMTSYDGKNHWA